MCWFVCVEVQNTFRGARPLEEVRCRCNISNRLISFTLNGRKKRRHGSTRSCTREYLTTSGIPSLRTAHVRTVYYVRHGIQVGCTCLFVGEQASTNQCGGLGVFRLWMFVVVIYLLFESSRSGRTGQSRAGCGRFEFLCLALSAVGVVVCCFSYKVPLFPPVRRDGGVLASSAGSAMAQTRCEWVKTQAPTSIRRPKRLM